MVDFLRAIRREKYDCMTCFFSPVSERSIWVYVSEVLWMSCGQVLFLSEITCALPAVAHFTGSSAPSLVFVLTSGEGMSVIEAETGLTSGSWWRGV